MKKIFALVDCNNFYVSCERIFNPYLKDKPVIVLSNNDGCAISRSNEVKELGIPMGAPIFKWRDLIHKNKVILYTPNFPLYGDISNRVMSVLRETCPYIEKYSIDEAFVDLTMIQDPFGYSVLVRDKLKKEIDMPVSIGIGPTKTLAKLANRLAKKSDGVFDMSKCEDIDGLLSSVGIDDIWGIGRQTSLFLKEHSIYTALQFKNADEIWIKKNLHLVGHKIYLELKGISCFEFETPVDKKGISVTRTFGHSVETKEDLKGLIGGFVVRASEKLRGQNSYTSNINVFVRTDRHKKIDQYSNGFSIGFSHPTSYTPELLKQAYKAVDGIYRKGYKYRRGGITLTDISSTNTHQIDIFDGASAKPENLMKAIDHINQKWKKDIVTFATVSSMPPARIGESKKSGRHTTNWNELLIVAAK